MTPPELTPSDPPSDLDTRRRRALYRAVHRGTKEMDWLLGKFATARLHSMDAAALTLFEQVLSLPDPDLNVWILDPARVTDLEFMSLVHDIRGFHALDTTLSRPMTTPEPGTER